MGDGLKIGIVRVQAGKLSKKTVLESSRDADGNLHDDGRIKRHAGDCYLVETTVTGSNCGTSSDPKFSLLACFLHSIFPKIERIVGPGGEYEGYLPVIQGDNAGPHQDREFVRSTKEFCDKKGWLWEPQAPQMPYSNNLDLAVFPLMSKEHTKVLKKRGSGVGNSRTGVASCDEIYKAAETVWCDFASADIARGFLLAYRICGKVIEERGDNKFLSGSEFHMGVRSGSVNTATGIVPSRRLKTKRKRNPKTEK